ncbi:hypothetical protein HMPREF2137_02435 [Hoylesella buccalis DNF00853]|uniref:Uncharacterized protein n=1 Tax=Hoylesella buccalis DNF00853 TaxID=1401074 RepID=A0A095ZNT9_9BACT|nr:hypothetical protein HMPREF2137_02435 [Hoylesella buccalis DNF00853]
MQPAGCAITFYGRSLAIQGELKKKSMITCAVRNQQHDSVMNQVTVQVQHISIRMHGVKST